MIVDAGDFRNKKNFFDLFEIRSEESQIRGDSLHYGFGGASNVWGGLCSRFTENELDRSAFDFGASWPISYRELKKYYEKAEEILDLGGTFGCADYVDEGGAHWRRLAAKIPPKNFKWDLNPLNYNLLKNCHVTKIDTKDGAVCSVSAKSPVKGIEAKIYCKYLILSCGCLESIRIIQSSSLTNTHGNRLSSFPVGSFYMNHPKERLSRFRFSGDYKILNKLLLNIDKSVASYFGLGNLNFPRSKKKALTHYIRLEPVYSWSDDQLVESFVNHIKSYKNIMMFILKKSSRSFKILDFSEIYDFRKNNLSFKHIKVKNVLSLVLYLLNRIGILSQKPKCYYAVGYYEIAPNLSNAVSVSDDTDFMNIQKCNVNFKIGKHETESMYLLLEVFFDMLSKHGKVFERTDDGFDRKLVHDASHHIGGLRMGKSPSISFVDQNLESHKIKNLFVVGSSVFPTGSSVNPTLTILALAIRLIDHIKGRLI